MTANEGRRCIPEFPYILFINIAIEPVAVIDLGGRPFHRELGNLLTVFLFFGFEQNYNVPAQVVLKEEFGFRTDVPGITSIRSPKDYPGESIMLTGDLNIVDVEWIIQYRIEDVYNWLFKIQERDKTIRTSASR